MTSWDDHRREIAERTKRDGLDAFLDWSVIHATMYVGFAPYIIQIEQPAVDRFFGDQSATWDTNTIHQAYHLMRWLEAGNSLDAVQTILEIGGGYGAMARLIRSLGYTGRYAIYDFPEVHTLQKFYLDKHSVEDIEFVTEIEPADLIVALWSLGEIPLGERPDLEAEHFLVAYSSAWDDIDNAAYFAGWIGKHEAIEHLPGNYYLLR